ncbi:PLDc N-terminal domain-containing protein [Roseovarius sp. Pro17]|uniref:PLDc N-terminal domain-containing protein n=1 Tax=Roseovarius sp. Pro17 TaxID=3108175 RepID=UPI002D773881|nr:PLDc N-terminal domain-containing protein [Roseovarius sp. Pro17]
MVNVTGVGSFIVLVLDVWAIVSIFGSSASTGRKVLWILLVILLPILGFILWLFLGPRAAKAGG